ncbi:MAG: ABC transporter permease [Bacteroidaceae bacterium]|nr:ABC transporter permease [Bacteroidaceae bacterium]
MKTSLFFIWKLELQRIFRDEGLLIFFLLVPLAYPLLYTFIYSGEVVRDVPTIAIDNDCSPLSRRFLRHVNATPDAEIVYYATNMGEAKELLRKRLAYGIIYLPKDFSNKLLSDQQAHVSLFCDMSGLLYYKSLLIACTDVSLAMNKELQISRMPDATSREAQVNATPIHYESIALFNPQAGFASFIIPAVLMLIIQQTMLLGAGLSAGTDRDRHQPMSNSSLVSLIGRALAYLTLYTATASYMLMVVPYLFDLPQLAELSSLLGFLFPYLLAVVFFSLACASFVPNREAAILMFVFTSLPLLFLSGISWPKTSIPIGWKIFSWLFPSTFGINGFVCINSMGGTPDEVKNPRIALWIQAIGYFLFAWWRMRKNNKKN